MVPTCCTTVGESFSFWGHIHDRRYNRLNSFFLRPPEALSGLGTEKCNLRAVQFLISAIFACIMSQKEEHLVPSGGEISGWADYSRKVRLSHSQTPVSKRYTLGPKLVLRLRGKAWEVAASLDHDELSKQNGAQYLLKFLKQRLGRLPIPDVGQHLDEVFVRMRRVPGMDRIMQLVQFGEGELQEASAIFVPDSGWKTQCGYSDRSLARQRDGCHIP